jgi:hypothetical protein
MAATFTTSLRLSKPADGDTNWGSTVNNGVTSLVDSAVAGIASITMTAANYTLTNSNGAADEARAMFLTLGGTPGGAYNVICPAVSKLYFVTNNTGFTQTIKTSAGTGVAVPTSKTMAVRCDGTNVFETTNYVSSANVNFLQSGTGTVNRTVQSKLQDVVSPKDFGAVGDGTTNDLTAVKAALESGKVVDGGGLTYAISGTCTPTSFVGLQNANFIQIGNNTATNFNTLNIVGFSNFFIDNVSINMGTNVTTLFADDANNGLYVAGAAYNSESLNFNISRVTVTGNGCGTGIHVRHAKRFTVTSCLVHNRVSGSSPDPTNDSQNGVQINNCANFVLADSNVYNLKTRLSSVDTVKWTRGFLFIEISDSTIVGCNATIVDQGFDFSGAYVSATNYIGNRRWTIGNCTANSCVTYGFKFANVSRDGLVTGCIASNTGSIAFVFSPSAAVLPLGLEKYNTQNIDVVGCKAVNALGTGYSGTNATGFRIMSNGIYIDYPRSIRFKSCSVIDTQDVPTTTKGFDSDAYIPEYPTTGYNESVANTTNDCTVSSNVTTAYTGLIGPNLCVITGGLGGETQSIPNNTVTEINWNTEYSDPTRLHSTSSNVNKIYIKTTGWYQLNTHVQFASNSVGVRSVQFYKNGGVVDRTYAAFNANSLTVTTVSSSFLTYLVSGDNVSVGVVQSSGGALNVNNNESYFSVNLVS